MSVGLSMAFMLFGNCVSFPFSFSFLELAKKLRT
jgi:hypothetical protein